MVRLIAHLLSNVCVLLSYLPAEIILIVLNVVFIFFNQIVQQNKVTRTLKFVKQPLTIQ